MLPYPGAFAICSLTIAGPRRSSSAIRRDRARTATVASHHGPAGPTGRSNPGRRSFRKDARSFLRCLGALIFVIRCIFGERSWKCPDDACRVGAPPEPDAA